MKILIVDDNPTNRKLLRATLEEEGMGVCEAPDGVDALERLGREPFDAIISDVFMPRMDGYRLCSEVRKSRHAAIPFVFYTNTFTSPSDEKLALSLGGNFFLKKPATGPVILEAIQELRKAPGELTPIVVSTLEEFQVLKEYSERLVSKLEEKNIELDQCAQEFRAVHEELRQLLAHSPVVIYKLKLDGAIITPAIVSDNVERLLGFTAAEATYDWWLGHLHPEDRDRVIAAFEQALKGDGYSIEYRIQHRDGTYRTVEDRNRVIRDASGQPQEIVGAWTDISERVRADGDRKRLEGQLMRNQRLESIGTLAGGIAHDLNNLLTPIIMGVGLLEDSTDPMVLKLVKPLQSSAATAIELVKQVLVFARGGQSERVALNPGAVLERLVKLLKQVIPRDIDIQTTISEDLWLISGDSTELHQVVLNLCVNARDAMPNGGKLTVGMENATVDASYASMQPGASAGRFVAIRVADTGTGIPPDVMDRIFEPFFTTKEVGKGTGLGLATVMGITRSYGGFVEVKSEVGQGSTFTAYLPALDEGEAPGTPPQRTESPRGKGETILIVDDEAMIREMMKLTLETYGYQTLTAGDGAEAVAVFAQNQRRIKAVIVDMMMPIMDGAAAIRAIRRIDPKVPIISASGLREKTKVMELTENEVQAFLAKPYSAEQLITVLQSVLRV